MFQIQRTVAPTWKNGEVRISTEAVITFGSRREQGIKKIVGLFCASANIGTLYLFVLWNLWLLGAIANQQIKKLKIKVFE